MNGRPFELIIDGEMRFCAAFETESERRAALSADLAPHLHVMAPPHSVKESAAGARGRPSFDVMLTEAVETLQLNPKQSLAERARAVLRHLAKTRDSSTLPSKRTVESFLAASPARRNLREKLCEKSDRVKLAKRGD